MDSRAVPLPGTGHAERRYRGPGGSLKVAIITKSTAEGGGANRNAEDLARLLNTASGVTAHHWLGLLMRPMEPHFRLLQGGGSRRIHRAFQYFSRLVGCPDFFTPEYFALWRARNFGYDIYHVHDTATTFSPIAMRHLARRKPVVWTFHDCSPFTGGCGYPMDCTAFHSRCGHCPQLQEWPLQTGIDRTGWMQDYKRRTARDDLFVPVVPSQWMADEAMRSGMFARRPQVIPYAVDSDTFRPADKARSRRDLGLPPDGFCVLVSAYALSVKRKGMAYALEALRKCARPVSVLLVGRPDPGVAGMLEGISCHQAGYIASQPDLARHYAAADVFVFPTLADNLPNSVLETMACGTPTIGFDVGGMPDMIEHGVTGWLAPLRDVDGLVAGLRLAYDNPELRRRWADEGRRRAEVRYSGDAHLRAHLDLYGQIMAGQYAGLHHLNLPRRTAA